ncbi:type VI secretion system baseplate subunit TssK [Pseudoduganella sp. OTU4001]|uniref:type VI secretion system baseplate subunit TssK n=1 Tax=Pseudoduganella sp. OTU4001 TaxID=3043854 RepID=UPI00313BE12B
MTLPAKILWSEGLFLRPQHFQQQDRYHEARIHATAIAAHPMLWGVQAIEWDSSALANGKLRLLALRALFREGELFDAPASDPLPEAVDLSTLPNEVQEVVFYAGMPSHETDRFAHTERETADLFSDALPAGLTYLRRQVRLVSDREPRGAFDSLPLLRLRRVVSGSFEPDPAFMPPSLSINATPRLRLLLDQLMDALQAKANALQGHMREPSRNVIEFRSGDVSSFWLLHTVSTAAATLLHLLRQPALHPERLYQAMLGLAGGLMTYSRQVHLGNLPAYDHAAPGPSFLQLDAVIRDLLDTVISARYFSIALHEEKPGYHTGKLDSGKIGAGATLYLAIAAAMPALELVDAVPLRVKAGAPDDVEQCVLSAMPGVKLLHAAQVPSAIPVRPDTFYFALENRGVLYEQMLKAQSISIYVPAGIKELRLELLVVTA